MMTPAPLPERTTPQRLNQILSAAGLTSRRKADQWIENGRVRLNGRRITALGTRAVWGRDRIEVDGSEIPGPTQRTYLVINKPFGYICSLNEPEGRPLVTDLIKDIPQRVYPVGRLDFDSMGLLLLTNDGEWAHRLTHPSYQTPRTYKATVEGVVSDEALDLLSRGVALEDGPTLPAKITLIKKGGGHTLLRITITQGKNRQIRRMLDAVGYTVIHLIRIGFGTLALGDLKVGEYRYLEHEEVGELKKFVKLP